MKSIINLAGQAFYLAEFLSLDEAKHYYNQLERQITWQTESLSFFGKQFTSPRRVAWHGEPGIAYRYSGITYTAPGWLAPLYELKEKLNDLIPTNFNSVLCNFYHDGNDYIGWHADNETSLGKNPTIASISLGQTRRFLFKHRQSQKIVELMLEPGSLLIMAGELQNCWLHSLPKQKTIKQPRINLTFREIIT